MRTEIFKDENTNLNGIQNWKFRFRYKGKEIEHVLGRIDEYSEQNAKEIANNIVKRIVEDGLIHEIRKDIIINSCPILKEFSTIYQNHIKNFKKSWDRDVRSLYHLNRLLGDFKLTDITKDKLREYQSTRLEEKSRKNGKPIKPASVNRETDCLRSVFNLAIEKDVYPFRNPLSNYDRLHENNFRKRILTREEENRLINVCESYLRNIIKCALHTAMRIGEILTLKWEGVDLNSGYILLQGKNTKNGKPRDIEINASMRTIFEEIKKSGIRIDTVFTNSRQKPYATPDAMKNAFKNALTRANIENFTFHDLRRTCATRMYENGKEIGVISEILGHSSTEMTKRYLSINNLKRDALESLDD